MFRQLPYRTAASLGGVQIARRAPEDLAERGRHGRAALQETGHRQPHAPRAKLREQHGNVRILSGRRAGGHQRPLDRLPEDVRCLRLVGNREARVEIRLEREFPQQ